MLVVVGGHSRNIGKTGVVAGLIRGLPEARWTAVKITQHGHGPCPQTGRRRECAGDPRHPYSLSEEADPHGRGDSARYLAAGARRSFWLRTAAGRLGGALPALRRVLDSSENALLESNSVLQFLRPDLYLVVLDSSVADFKDSTRRYLDRADAFLLAGGGPYLPSWKGIAARRLESKPRFRVSPPEYTQPELIDFVRWRMGLRPVPAKR